MEAVNIQREAEQAALMIQRVLDEVGRGGLRVVYVGSVLQERIGRA